MNLHTAAQNIRVRFIREGVDPAGAGNTITFTRNNVAANGGQELFYLRNETTLGTFDGVAIIEGLGGGPIAADVALTQYPNSSSNYNAFGY